MASNIFSRFASQDRGRSFYEDLRASDPSDDVEGDGGNAIDEANLSRPFQDYDLDQAERIEEEGSRISLYGGGGAAAAGDEHSTPRDRKGRPKDRDAQWLSPGGDDDADNDVPESLLVEHPPKGPKQQPSNPRERAAQSRPIPGPSTKKSRAQWEAAQAQQRLHHEEPAPISGGAPNRSTQPVSLMTNVASGSAREKAMWRWVNVSNLDNFMADVYDYYLGCGFWCITLERALHLLNVAFVAVFLTFLTQCIDYHKIPQSNKLSQVMIPKCTQKMGTMWSLGLWIFTFYFVWKSIQYVLDLRRLLLIRDFYRHLLNIPEDDMQTVSWQDVVARIMVLRDANPKTAANLSRVQRGWIGSQSKERLDAHDIANRLMRKENYLIALFNKDILDLTIPLPYLNKRLILSRTLEWTLKFSILDLVFDSRGHVNQEFLKAGRRGQLSRKLRFRFIFAGFMNLILAPFLAFYLTIVYFLTYYHEFKNNPSSLSSRSYTPLAEWKFREFNELRHLFTDRLNMSHPFAKRYIDQFPKYKTEEAAKTIAFISGAIVAVLAIATLLDSEMFLKFEITQDRTAIFYITVFGGIWATARGMISGDNDVFDPEYAMRSVIEFTHYEPDNWQGRLHSQDVKVEFSELYKAKIVIFMEEIISILTTPLVLLYSLPKSSDQVIDFFREFTIHVDGLGYVCSFAVFDFKKGLGDHKQSAAAVATADVRDDYYSTKHGKMAASFYGFLDNYIINPKTGMAGHQHLPPAARPGFQPPPSFPNLYSSTLAADLQSSRLGRDRARSRPRGPIAPQGWTPQFRPAMPQPSPMTSVLLDPHHQPAPSTFGASTHRPRQQRGGYPGDRSIIEEATEDGGDAEPGADKRGGDELEDIYESGGALDESTWQTSPTKTLSRENSGVNAEEPEIGVLGLMYQFQQAHMNIRR